MYLHLVSFDIPYPANYGGVIVIFNQIKALHAAGVRIILHCYQYGGREQQPELERYCHAVYYYSRSRNVVHQLSFLPFIMRTRQSKQLLNRLRLDDHPILFEGMHTAALVWHKKLRGRQKLVRMHNVEWKYYESLSELSEDWLEKLYFFVESLKLQRIEPKVVLHADTLLTLSSNDQRYYAAMKANTHYLPAFHPNDSVENLSGRGEYVLFHGKLSVADNEKAAIWLMREVFKNVDLPFVVAGMEPSDRLKEEVARHPNVTLVENPDEPRMNDLIRNAHINLLVSFQNAGIKLKLINALFRGRFCIVDDVMVDGTGLKSLCYVRNTATAIRQTIEALGNTSFESTRADERKAVLEAEFSNPENARKLIDLIRFSQPNQS